jgi:hypothetical protein
MKKSLRFFGLLGIALSFLPGTLYAQVPQTFNYQAIARDAGGNVLPAHKIGVELSVLDGGPAGTVVYQETFIDTTNAFGLFTLQVGGGVVVSGTFTGINWATGNKYLQTAIDLAGGTNYALSGTTQLLSVPYALYAQNSLAGTGNTAMGYDALSKNSSGMYNTAAGEGALARNSTGAYNVAIGAEALQSTTIANSITAIGAGADISVDGLVNATAIGYKAIAINSNFVQIGNNQVTTIQGPVPFTTPSDGRFKFNIREDVRGLDFIMKLRPVTYQFNTKKEEDFIRGVRNESDFAGAMPVAYNEAMMVRRTGFIAQEVEKAAQQSGYDFDGLKAPKTAKEYYSLSYASFVVPLVKAVQEQQNEIRELRAEVKELRKLIKTAKTKKP